MDEVKRYTFKSREAFDPLATDDWIKATDYDALLAKYRELEASIPARERAAFMCGFQIAQVYDFDETARVEALLRYPDKEARK